MMVAHQSYFAVRLLLSSLVTTLIEWCKHDLHERGELLESSKEAVAAYIQLCGRSSLFGYHAVWCAAVTSARLQLLDTSNTAHMPDPDSWLSGTSHLSLGVDFVHGSP